MDNEEFFDDDELSILVLVDDEGVEHQFELLHELEIENETYRVLIPLCDEEEDAEEWEAEIVILKVVYDEEGNEFLSEIEDEEEWEFVADAWQELVENEDL